MKPLDPKLLTYARAARGYLVLTVTTGLVTAGLVVTQALLLGRTLGGAVHDGLDLNGAATAITWLVVVVAARFLVTTVQERFAHRAATAAVNELREQVVEHGTRLGPRWLAGGEGPALVTLATRGLDALQPYFVNYLPQLVLAATLTPATLLVVLSFDWLSAVIITVTIPLVPIFMILVGKLTQGRSEKGLAAMERLGSQVLDLIAGLPTLRALGRQAGPVRRVQELGDAHRRATMGTLRIAFLSGMVLELLTTISVALVAVTIGFRLVYGDVDLVTALTVLVLAPEVFNPLRAVGTQYHASTDGVAAAEAAFTILETPVPPRGQTPCPDLRRARVRLDGVGVRSSGGWTPQGLDLELAPGTVTALVGRSGIGKSTAVDVVLGLLGPDAGAVTVVPEHGTPVDLREIDPRSYWDQVSWLPQRPFLEPGTVHELVGDVDPVARDRAAALTGLDQVVAGLPDGWQTALGTGGTGLSVGQRQRVALTRALLTPAPLVVLDEPTAHLDASGEQVVLDTVGALREAGSAVLLVAHRASLVRTADVVVQVRAGADDEAPADSPDVVARASTDDDAARLV
ncbi:thiol reductant ABC exporter subunit CydD [Cellulomonas citrea]|uniref:thiol reductant ABC exporter subunit CydD n=1 Tax=Cellulomonas citrea TaxID=1909423 RepID=UPI00135AB81D|nr:thiol reductant ABC exporter subunit CydD [Cellulomonas citrea]